MKHIQTQISNENPKTKKHFNHCRQWTHILHLWYNFGFVTWNFSIFHHKNYLRNRTISIKCEKLNSWTELKRFRMVKIWKNVQGFLLSQNIQEVFFCREGKQKIRSFRAFLRLAFHKSKNMLNYTASHISNKNITFCLWRIYSSLYKSSG